MDSKLNELKGNLDLNAWENKLLRETQVIEEGTTNYRLLRQDEIELIKPVFKFFIYTLVFACDPELGGLDLETLKTNLKRFILIDTKRATSASGAAYIRFSDKHENILDDFAIELDLQYLLIAAKNYLASNKSAYSLGEIMHTILHEIRHYYQSGGVNRLDLQAIRAATALRKYEGTKFENIVATYAHLLDKSEEDADESADRIATLMCDYIEDPIIVGGLRDAVEHNMIKKEDANVRLNILLSLQDPKQATEAQKEEIKGIVYLFERGVIARSPRLDPMKIARLKFVAGLTK